MRFQADDVVGDTGCVFVDHKILYAAEITLLGVTDFKRQRLEYTGLCGCVVQKAQAKIA